MIPWRTMVGLAAGSVIIVLGASGLVLHAGVSDVTEEGHILTGDSALYAIPAPAGTVQRMDIAGDAFDVLLEYPGEPRQESSYRGEASLEWTHGGDGESRIRVENTGDTELEVDIRAVRSYDPIWITYDLMVMVSGVVIIGFSMGFVLRRPKGF